MNIKQEAREYGKTQVAKIYRDTHAAFVAKITPMLEGEETLKDFTIDDDGIVTWQGLKIKVAHQLHILEKCSEHGFQFKGQFTDRTQLLDVVSAKFFCRACQPADLEDAINEIVSDAVANQ